MATYDLKCRSCGKKFEVFVPGFLKEKDKVCPDCGGRDVEQCFTGFGGVLGVSSPRRCGRGSCGPQSCSKGSGFT